MKRRKFITLLGGAAAVWPLAARAQQPAMPMIGYLSVGSPIGHLLGVFKQSVAEADVIHAHNVFAHVPDPNRFAGGIKRLLKPRGVAVVEAPSLHDLIAKLEFDSIYKDTYS